MAAKAFDEMTSGTAGQVRAPYRGVASWLAQTSPEKVAATRHEVDVFYRRHGITWIPQQLWRPVVKSRGLWPICIHPYAASSNDWELLQSGQPPVKIEPLR
jgi:uncharacterized circularly permuted ATP-grasp superfamily protein